MVQGLMSNKTAISRHITGCHIRCSHRYINEKQYSHETSKGTFLWHVQHMDGKGIRFVYTWAPSSWSCRAMLPPPSNSLISTNWPARMCCTKRCDTWSSAGESTIAAIVGETNGVANGVARETIVDTTWFTHLVLLQ